MATPDTRTTALQVESHLQHVLQELSAAGMCLSKLGTWASQLDLAKSVKEIQKQCNVALKQAKELQA